MIRKFLNAISTTPRTHTKVTSLVLPLAYISILPLCFLFYEEFLSDYFTTGFSMTEYRLYSRVNKYLIWWILFFGPVVILLAQRHWRVLSKWAKRILLIIMIITLPFELFGIHQAYVIAFGSRIVVEPITEAGTRNKALQLISEVGGTGADKWVDFYVENRGESTYDYYVDLMDHSERGGFDNRIFTPCPQLSITTNAARSIVLPECIHHQKIDDYSNQLLYIKPGETKLLYRWHFDECLRERLAFAGEDYVCVKKKKVNAGQYQASFNFSSHSKDAFTNFFTETSVNVQ